MEEMYTTIIKALPTETGDFDIDVKTDLESQDKLALMLLLVVEKITGVSTDNYVAEVDSHRVRAGS